MNYYHAHADPPRSLASRLRSLNDNLQELASRLKEAIASAVSSTLGQAIRDLIRQLLGDEESRPGERRSYGGAFEDQSRSRSYGKFDREDRYWEDRDDDRWNEEKEDWKEPAQTPSNSGNGRRLNVAFSTAIQSALWWLRTQPCRRPVLTTTLVALAAGGTALIAGPTLAAGVSVIASIASLLLASDSARSACSILSG
jgi:hypothetical protein